MAFHKTNTKHTSSSVYQRMSKAHICRYGNANIPMGCYVVRGFGGERKARIRFCESRTSNIPITLNDNANSFGIFVVILALHT